MEHNTLKLFSIELKISIQELEQKFLELGIKKNVNDIVSFQERKELLEYIVSNSITENDSIKTNKNLILQRKTRSTLKIPSAGGKSKSIQIEVRKKCTYVPSNINLKKITQEKKILENSKKSSFSVFPEENNKIHDIDVRKNILNKKKLLKDDKIIHENIDDDDLHQKNNVNKIKNIFKEKKLSKIEKKNEQLIDNIKNKKEKYYSNLKNFDLNFKKYKEENIVEDVKYVKFSEDENSYCIDDDNRNKKIHLMKKVKKKKYNCSLDISTEKEEKFFIKKCNENKQIKISSLIQKFNKPEKKFVRDVILGENISVVDLANKMSVKVEYLVKIITNLGITVSVNKDIDQQTAQLIVEEMGHNVILRYSNNIEDNIFSKKNNNEKKQGFLKPRSPVVTMMGHVDHGKTSLLDYIRLTNVVDKEAGGITQHIGAYQVSINKKNTKHYHNQITFFDTPGHSAFTAMRARGAKVTDIIILVIAADDGIMPQTIEAINHAKSARVTLIIAINKIDKESSNLEKIKKELMKYEIFVEDLGGEIQCVYVSAKTGQGVDALLDAILLQSEMLELKSSNEGNATGVVIESSIDKGKGVVVSVLVQEGTLYQGDTVLCGSSYGRIRSMRNDTGLVISSAGPSTPVEILGLSSCPISGDIMVVFSNEKQAKEIALYRQGKNRDVKLYREKILNVENIFSNISSIRKKELNIILKSDVQGSSEAIREALKNLSNNEIKINIINYGIGRINETDVTLAISSNSVLIGFNVTADISARRLLEEENVKIQYYSVIYHLIDDIKKSVLGMLSVNSREKILGVAEVRNLFHSLKFGTIAGCMVKEGILIRNNKIRVFRNKVFIYLGELESLKRFKDDVNEVRQGMECGIKIKNYNDLLLGDSIEMFELIN